MEQKWWAELGVHVDPRPYGDRPWKELEEYAVLIDMTIQHRQPHPEPKPGVRRG